MNLEKFTYQLPIQARWNDLDPLGHVNNAVFISYFEIGRGRYMNSASNTWNWNTHMFLLGKIEATYLKELTLLHKHPKIWVRTSRFGTKSFDIDYAVTSANQEGETTVHCVGKSTQVMFDMKKRQSTEIPNWLRNELSNYEKVGSIN